MTITKSNIFPKLTPEEYCEMMGGSATVGGYRYQAFHETYVKETVDQPFDPVEKIMRDEKHSDLMRNAESVVCFKLKSIPEYKDLQSGDGSSLKNTFRRITKIIYHMSGIAMIRKSGE